MISIDELKDKLKIYGYYATEELVYTMYNQLVNFNDDENFKTQAIFALCLEGPPGAGKSEYAKVYRKLASEIYDEEISFLSYQCNETTGINEMYEDINIAAAVKGDYDNVNIPGKLVQAINLVNEGKKVILFIDELDKAREETDAFLLEFLQDGKIGVTQHGDLQIKKEYQSNLQVIFCKNDYRKNLSGPLTRRTRIVRLDYMKPVVAYKLLKDLALDKVNLQLLQIIILIYEQAYKQKEIFKRLPSFSEMYICAVELSYLMSSAKGKNEVIYKLLFSYLFKDSDDLETMKSLVKKVTTLKEYLVETNESDESLTDLFKEDNIKNTLDLNILSLVNKDYQETYTGNFIETDYIKQNTDIFSLSNQGWSEVANIGFNALIHQKVIDFLCKYAKEYEVVVYNNGILINNIDDFYLIVMHTHRNNKTLYTFLSNYKVIPEVALGDIISYAHFLKQVLENQELDSNSLILSIKALVNLSHNHSLATKKVMDNLFLVEQEISLELLPNRNDFTYLNMDEVKKLVKVVNKAPERSK